MIYALRAERAAVASAGLWARASFAADGDDDEAAAAAFAHNLDEHPSRAALDDHLLSPFGKQAADLAALTDYLNEGRGVG